MRGYPFAGIPPLGGEKCLPKVGLGKRSVQRSLGGSSVQTVGDLKALTVKQLAQMAKCRGVPGWHSMRKAELIKALSKILKAEQRRAAKLASTNLLTQHTLGVSDASPRASPKPNGSRNGRSAKLKGKGSSVTATSPGNSTEKPPLPPPPPPDPKDLTLRDPSCEPTADRIVLMVRDPYWLQAVWEITRQTVERARVALGQQWHLAKPVLRLVELDPEGVEIGDRRVIRDIEIHGAVNNWYIDVADPPRSFQVDLGYVVPGGKFHVLARSNVVTTRPGPSYQWWPKTPQQVPSIDWDRVLALTLKDDGSADADELRDFLEEKLDRPVSSRTRARLSSSLSSYPEEPENTLPLELDAEVILYGTTLPGTRVTVRGEPVEVRPDGSFVLRYPFPDRRQVFPVVAWSRDGTEHRTILVAVERNTKVMEPVLKETDY